MRRLIIGGARSGKSQFAESLLAGVGAVDYVATAPTFPEDAEWQARIRAHRARRPASWRTIETLDVASVLTTPGPPVLVDCLTVWLSQVMDQCGSWDEGARPQPAGGPDGSSAASRVATLIEAITATPRETVLVTNEVGLGVVPAHASGRLFRDEMGTLNARTASACDEVWFLCAGIPQRLKG